MATRFSLLCCVVSLWACAEPGQEGLDSGVTLLDAGSDGGSVDVGPGFDANRGPDGGPNGDVISATDAATDAGTDAATGEPLLVDPTCVDGLYRETFPNVTAPVADIAFTGDIGAYVDAFLGRRYPMGARLVVGGRAHPAFRRLAMRHLSAAPPPQTKSS